MEPTAVLYYNF